MCNSIMTSNWKLNGIVMVTVWDINVKQEEGGWNSLTLPLRVLTRVIRIGDNTQLAGGPETPLAWPNLVLITSLSKLWLGPTILYQLILICLLSVWHIYQKD